MKRNNTKKLVLISLCIGINVIGALIAVTLKLPIFLDTIGTFLIAFLFGYKWVYLRGTTIFYILYIKEH